MLKTLQTLTVVQLKELALARGLSQQGKKSELAARLIEDDITDADLPEAYTEAASEAASGVRILVCESPYNPSVDVNKTLKEGGFTEVPVELQEGADQIVGALRAAVPMDPRYAKISAVGAFEKVSHRGNRALERSKLMFSGEAGSFPNSTVASHCAAAADGKTVILFPLPVPTRPLRAFAEDTAVPQTGPKAKGTVAFGYGIQSRGSDKVILVKNGATTNWCGQKHAAGTLEHGDLVRMAEEAREKDVTKYGSDPLTEDSTELFIITSQPTYLAEAQNKKAAYFILPAALDPWGSVNLGDGQTIRIAVSCLDTPPLDLSLARSRGTGHDPLLLGQYAKKILEKHWLLHLRGGSSASQSAPAGFENAISGSVFGFLKVRFVSVSPTR